MSINLASLFVAKWWAFLNSCEFGEPTESILFHRNLKGVLARFFKCVIVKNVSFEFFLSLLVPAED
jgi:hypothetical protein